MIEVQNGGEFLDEIEGRIYFFNYLEYFSYLVYIIGILFLIKFVLKSHKAKQKKGLIIKGVFFRLVLLLITFIMFSIIIWSMQIL